MVSLVPKIRIALCNQVPVNAGGEFVLYWMTAFRRAKWNFSLDRALEWACELKRPLVILEALRCGYPWACDRFHCFVMDGMAEKAQDLASHGGVFYYPYLELSVDGGKGLLRALGARACVVVTDDYPGFFLAQMTKSAAQQLSCRLEAVDSNGLLPLRAADRVFLTAFSFRRFLQKSLPAHLTQFPKRDPLVQLDLPALRSLPAEIVRTWPPATKQMLAGASVISTLPINHNIGITSLSGGEEPARLTMQQFLDARLPKYLEFRNQPEHAVGSELSPYLHFGHISSHQVFDELMHREKWSEERISLRSNGSRQGWWGVSRSGEAFLDQLVTWREVGFNFSSHALDDSSFDSLPGWAQKTLSKHARDERDHIYSLDEFATANTHDRLWNAAQRQLLQEGRLHNYLRMLWGKKILEWTRTPLEAMKTMIELNNRYALDGRDPNSYNGIFWCLGRYDRPWGPERPVFGTVRYMSSENTARKVRVRGYIEKYGPHHNLYDANAD